MSNDELNPTDVMVELCTSAANTEQTACESPMPAGPLLKGYDDRPSVTPYMRRAGPLDEGQRIRVGMQQRHACSVMKDVTHVAREKGVHHQIDNPAATLQAPAESRPQCSEPKCT